MPFMGGATVTNTAHSRSEVEPLIHSGKCSAWVEPLSGKCSAWAEPLAGKCSAWAEPHSYHNDSYICFSGTYG